MASGSESFVIMSSSPYYLNPLDDRRTTLSDDLLTRKNYWKWWKSAKLALFAKNKLGFVDGTIKKPLESSPEFHAWEKADSMVYAWIVNSIDPSLHDIIFHVPTARDLWKNLQQRFYKGDQPRVRELYKSLRYVTQEPNMPLNDYYHNYSSMMEELAEQLPPLECVGEDTKIFLLFQEDLLTRKFVLGLDDRFSHMTVSLLNYNPMPPLRTVFDRVLSEDARLTLDKCKKITSS
ncbi:uncharacterized protein LOC127120429 [Lathyrus oleraceus]|uniref:uncharacterized protein LOC127120429 n=1 Tax=Pisum sativum TaxID=3888 RepID=UPI0021D19B4D|nr:uncharacterized protein LOC127120429 [Pisum sativum]